MKETDHQCQECSQLGQEICRDYFLLAKEFPCVMLDDELASKIILQIRQRERESEC